MKPSRFLVVIGCCALSGGCAPLTQIAESLPRDQKGWTSQIQRERVLVVGVAKPEDQDKPIAEREKRIVQELASRLGAQVKWHEGNVHSLLEDLEQHRLPLVVAQLSKKSPFAIKLGFSQTIYTRESDKTEYSIAVAPGENRLLLLLDQIIADERKTNANGGNK